MGTVIAVTLIDWIVGAWAIMLMAGIIHAMVLPALIPFSFGVALVITGVWAVLSLIRGIVAMFVAAATD